MSYQDGLFKKNQGPRRILRNAKRSEFLASQGKPVLKNPMELDLDPIAQNETIQTLLEKAKEADPENGEFLERVKDLHVVMTLGSGGFSTSDLDRPTPQSTSWRSLQTFFS